MKTPRYQKFGESQDAPFQKWGVSFSADLEIRLLRKPSKPQVAKLLAFLDSTAFSTVVKSMLADCLDVQTVEWNRMQIRVSGVFESRSTLTCNELHAMLAEAMVRNRIEITRPRGLLQFSNLEITSEPCRGK